MNMIKTTYRLTFGAALSSHSSLNPDVTNTPAFSNLMCVMQHQTMK